MKNFKYLLIIATLSSIHINAEPCNCLWHGSFANIADRADLIVSGQIIRSKGNAMDLHIDRILIDKENNGKEFNEDIRIWADNGSQCRPQIDLFAMNSHWLMALYKITENIQDHGWVFIQNQIF